MIYRNKLFTSITSLFLVFVMLFTMLPLSVFAVGGGGEGGEGQIATGFTDGSWWSPGPFNSWEQMRFSLYFAEGSWNSLDEIIEAETKDPDSVKYIRLGKIVDVLITGNLNSNSNYWVSDKSVMDRMANNYKNMGRNYDDGMYIKPNIKDTMLLKSEVGDWATTFPILFDMDGTAQKNRWNQFFMGVDKVATDGSNWADVDLTQTMAIIEKILEGTGITITEENYKNGVYINSFGDIKYGVYKLYFEPMSMFVMGTYQGKTNRYLMTMRDFLAYNEANPDIRFKGSKEENGEIVERTWEFWRAFHSASITLGNSVYLITDEPLINMKAISGVKDSGRQPGTNMYDGGGLGVIIGFPRAGRETPQLVKTYVEIDSVDADGTIHYKKAATTTIEDIEFYVDDNGNYAPFPLFEQLETSKDGRVAVLNDVITTPHDLDVTMNTEWVETDLITNTGIELKANSSDIAGYMFGLVTGSELFIDSYTEYTAVNKKSDSAFKSLTNYVDKLLETLAAVAGTTWQLFSFDNFRRSADAEELTVVSKLTEAVEYTHHLSTEQKLAKLTAEELNELDYTPEITIVRAGIVDEETGEVIKLTEEYKKMLEQESGLEQGLGINTASNTVVLRYIVKPHPQQVNLLRIFEKDDDGNLTEKSVIVENPIGLDIAENVVNIKKPTTVLPSNVIGEPTVKQWVTNSEYPVIDIVDSLPTKSNDGLSGTATTITNYPNTPITHNLYVEWTIILDASTPVDPSTSDVPEWRLSRFLDGVAYDKDGDGIIDYSSAGMYFTKTADKGCDASDSYITNSGTYTFYVINPNGQKSDNNKISMSTIGTVGSTNIDDRYKDLTPNTWFYAKGYVADGSTDSISHEDNTASIKLDTTLNMVKSKDNGSLVLANWITGNTSLSDYAINSGNKPVNYTGTSEYSKYADLRVGIYNKLTYTHYYGYRSHVWAGLFSICCCGLSPETISPNSSNVSYTTANYGLDVSFDRYIQEATTGLTVAKETKSSNGFTTLRYQLNETLNIYPEYGMLFEDETGTETLKWVIGDKSRQIKPVVYQSMEHKVYVIPASNGTSVATDSRATTAVNSLVMSDSTAKGKQLIYKGAGVNTSYKLQRDSGNTGTALLTVKTYALDIGDATLKTAWNNSSYNSYDEHSALITNIKNSNKASITEKLLVDAKPYLSLDLNNAQKTSTSNEYKMVNYNSNSLKVDNGNAVCFEHKLIVRAGRLIGVKMQKTDGTYQTVAMTALKSTNNALYNALVEMKLYSESNIKSETLLKVFDSQKGKGLTESLYISKLLDARKSLDSLNDSAYSLVNPVLNKGWYSEDTTVLVVKEYVTNFEVPSTSVSDKLPMTITGLTTPTNKAQFFTSIGKGYTYLKYDLPVTAPAVSGITEKVSAYFEFSSFPGDSLGFGRQGVDYLVPNVSITDTTRLN